MWTPNQKAAIEAPCADNIVSAAAGSGKTAVLVERIISRVLSGEVDIDKLLVVTFTTAAAAEKYWAVTALARPMMPRAEPMRIAAGGLGANSFSEGGILLMQRKSKNTRSVIRYSCSTWDIGPSKISIGIDSAAKIMPAAREISSVTGI